MFRIDVQNCLFCIGPNDGAAEGQGEGQDGRRRGGRGRNRRGERREEALTDAPVDTTDGLPANVDAFGTTPASATEAAAETQAAPLSAAETNVLSEVLNSAPNEAAPRPLAAPQAPAQAAPEVAAVTEPAAVAATPFVLPMGELHAIAQSAGLEWVNSDAERIRQVQEAISREPKPVHVPRERKPVVLVDEGPLVLVETRKDLSQVTLPFEHQA